MILLLFLLWDVREGTIDEEINLLRFHDQEKM
jgi:hypothetical protein